MNATQADELTFSCECGEPHEIPLHLNFAMPDFVNKLLPWERNERVQFSPDWTIVDEKYFYLHGVMELPIAGTKHVLSWEVWTTVNIDDFDRTMELWDDPARTEEPDYAGALANSLPSYDETRNVKTWVRTRKVGERPLVFIDDPDHELASEQKKGVPKDRVIGLAKVLIHTKKANPYSHLCEK